MSSKVFDNVDVKPSIDVQTGTSSDTDGSSVDTRGYRDGMLVVHVGSVDDADGDETYDVKIQESDDDSSWSDSGVTLSVPRDTSDNSVLVARVKELNVARSRYLRASLVTGGTTPSIDLAADIALGEPAKGPVNDD